MIASVLLQRGLGHPAQLLEELVSWLEENEYESVEQMRGSMNLSRCPDPAAYERANYMRTLQQWRAAGN